MLQLSFLLNTAFPSDSGKVLPKTAQNKRRHFSQTFQLELEPNLFLHWRGAFFNKEHHFNTPRLEDGEVLVDDQPPNKACYQGVLKEFIELLR